LQLASRCWPTIPAEIFANLAHMPELVSYVQKINSALEDAIGALEKSFGAAPDRHTNPE
jgi:hypothetical protein